MKYHLFNTFPRHLITCSSTDTFPNIRKGLVKVTFPLPLKDLNGSLSRSSLKVYFRTVMETIIIPVEVQNMYHMHCINLLYGHLLDIIRHVKVACTDAI